MWLLNGLVSGALILGGAGILDAFLATLRANPNATATAVTAPNAQSSTLGFDVPPGYVQERKGDVTILAPAVASERTPCIYGIAGVRPATGNLEADAESALLQAVIPGWRKLDDRHYAMRGVAAAGWSYVWYRAAFEGEINGQRQAVNAMAMVLPAGQGRVHVVWGMGNIARCLLDDATFEQLFHSLRPGGWASDGGQAFTRALTGTWRYTSSAGLQQFTFRGDGTYDRDLGSRANVGISERTSATATSGRLTVQDGQIVLTPDHRPNDRGRYRIRLYDEWFVGGWKRALAMLDGSQPPLVIPYYRVDDTQR